MSETNWTATAPEPDVRGKVTKTVKVAPVAASDDPLKAGAAMLADAAKTAHQAQDEKIAAVRKSLAPVVKEAAALLKEFQDLSAMYLSRLEELATVARSRDLRRYHGIDRALEQIDRLARGSIQMLVSGQRVLSSIPQRVKDLNWTEVQTQKYLDFERDVACFRDVPKGFRGSVQAVERLLSEVEAIVAKSKPTRQFIDADLTEDNRPTRQTRADDSYDPFPGTPQNQGTPEPFAL